MAIRKQTVTVTFVVEEPMDLTDPAELQRSVNLMHTPEHQDKMRERVYDCMDLGKMVELGVYVSEENPEFIEFDMNPAERAAVDAYRAEKDAKEDEQERLIENALGDYDVAGLVISLSDKDVERVLRNDLIEGRCVVGSFRSAQVLTFSDGIRYRELVEAANRIRRSEGDDHHVFLEGFSIQVRGHFEDVTVTIRPYFGS